MSETAIEPDPMLRGVVKNSAHRAMRQAQSRGSDNDGRTKYLLGQWVSELEPTLHVAKNGVIAGIGDSERVLIWAPGYPEPRKSLNQWLHEVMTSPVFP